MKCWTNLKAISSYIASYSDRISAISSMHWQ